MPRQLTRYSGFNISELIMVLSIIGLVALAGVVMLLSPQTSGDITAITHNSIKQLHSAMDLTETEQGLIPRTFGPAAILQDNLQSQSAITNAPTPPGCDASSGTFRVVDGPQDMSVTLQSGAIIAGVHPDWRSYLGIGDADVVCVAPQGLDSNPDDVRFVTLVRKGNHLPGEFISDTLIAHTPSGTEAPPTLSLADPSLRNAPIATGSNNAGDVTVASMDLPFIEIYKKVVAMGSMNGDADWLWVFQHHFDTTLYAPDSIAHTLAVFNTLQQFGFGPAQLAMLQTAGSGRYGVDTLPMTLIDEDGNHLFDVSSRALFQSRLTFDGVPYDSATHGGGDGLVLNFLRTDTEESAYSGINQILYNHPNGDVYDVSAAFFSPIKVSLDGIDAQLNTTHHLAFDVDGFTQQTLVSRHLILPNRGIITTSGGLHVNEAWLAVDKEANGFFQNGTLDGNDVFGDHMGQYASGYDELATLFAHHLKTDPQGNRYLELAPLSPNEKRAILLKRLAGDTQLHPSFDLKLVTQNGTILPAHQVLKRIDVNYTTVNECDTAQRTCILQRATVTYTHGRTAQSADQWFSAKH